MCIITMLWTGVHRCNEAECFATHWHLQHALSSSKHKGSIYGSSLFSTMLPLTMLNSKDSHDIRGMIGVDSAYLKQVKDAVAEAYDKHACSPMIVNCGDLCPSLIEEVLGPQSPSASCTHQTANQFCTDTTQHNTNSNRN